MTALYIHIPFCEHKCHYCDFAVRVLSQTSQLDHYLQYLHLEIESYPRTHYHTLYMGGGTPSLLSAKQMETTYKKLNQHHQFSGDLEWSLEVNPETISNKKFKAFRHMGINRLSMGIQSFDPKVLNTSGRHHSVDDIKNGFHTLRELGFQNISCDLIYGLPHQTLKTWENTLKHTLALEPDHLSLYHLEVHQKTVFGHLSKQGSLPLPTEETGVQAYEMACDYLAQADYEHYEIANWARPGYQCKHNLSYWRNEPYQALGVGAHGYDQHVRYANPFQLKGYYDMCQAQKWAHQNTPKESPMAEIEETLLMNFRLLKEGLNKEVFAQRFGRRIESFYPKISQLIKKEWITDHGSHLTLSPQSVMFSNEIFVEFLEPEMVPKSN